mmetsp:Transcript_69395/g.185184  ORF Transcript_69395/g.185184 Transcript_69395/m.185184 type:complete len:463 (-) Transcript_69395:135-1523(-)
MANLDWSNCSPPAEINRRLFSLRRRVLPARHHRLELRVEVHRRLAEEVEVAKQRLLGGAPGEEGQRHRDWDVDAHLADLDLVLELACGAARGGEDHHAVAHGVGVDQLDGGLEGGGGEAAEHRREHLLGVARHARRHPRHHRRPQEVAALKPRHRHPAAVEGEHRALREGGLEDAQRPLQRLLADHGADVHARLRAAADLEAARLVYEGGDPLGGVADEDGDRDSHAALARRPERRPDDAVESLLLVGVGQHHGVVLGPHVALAPLAARGRGEVHLPPDGAAAHEGDGTHGGVGAEELDHGLAAMQEAEDAGRQARLGGEARDDHGGRRHLFGWLQDERVAGPDGYREHPEHNHGGEVERGNADNNSERLAVRRRVHVLGDLLHGLAHHQCRHGNCVLNHLNSTSNITFGINHSLSVLTNNRLHNFGLILLKQRSQLDQYTNSLLYGNISPSSLGLDCEIDA